jgi:hypothetical protein
LAAPVRDPRTEAAQEEKEADARLHAARRTTQDRTTAENAG